MARCCFADNDMHDSNEISANTDEDGDVVCVDGSYKSISPTDKLVVFDGSQSLVIDNYVCSSDVFNNYKPGVLEQTNVVEHGDEDYILPMMHVVNMYETLVIEVDSRIHSSFSDMRGDSIRLPLESTGVGGEGGGGYSRNFLKGNRERFNVTCGLEITEKPVVKCKNDALWFRRLTDRSNVVVYPTDYKFYSPRRKGKRDRMSNGSDYFQSVKNYPISGKLIKNASVASHFQDRPVSVNEGQIDNSKLYTDCSLEMNVDEAMKLEVAHNYSDKKIVELSVDSVSNENMVNNKEVCKKERIIRRALNTISSCQSKLIDIESSDDEDLSARVRVETIEGETSILTPAGHAYNWNRMVSRNVDHLYNISKLAREVKEFDLDLAERVMEVVREDMCNIMNTRRRGWNPFCEKLNPDYSVCTKSPDRSKVWISLICKEIDSIQDLMTLSRELLKKDYRMSESLLMLARIKMQDTLSWMDSKDDHYFSFGIPPMETNLIYWEWDKVIDLVSGDEVTYDSSEEDEDWSVTMKYQDYVRGITSDILPDDEIYYQPYN
ncbi:putative zinc finger CCCH domain-containing protein 17-like protein [Tanacetum coccineum]|uniref:Zinc finger CCCH domain-containing protein 17-like protein n=1 Tax=Tanacetum coccineum TaxID=301880 RepID=A0ABQ5FLR3_9ASTR